MRLPRLIALPLAVAVAGLFGPAPETALSAQAPWDAKVDRWVLSTAGVGPTEFLVYLTEQADVSAAHGLEAREDKGRYVTDTLRETAARTQGPLLAFLSAQGAEHRAYWIANMIWVRGDRALVEALALRDDVAHIYANPWVRFHEPVERDVMTVAPDAIEWGVTRVRAPEVWAAGFTGQGVVIGGQDTGYAWDHPALKGKYRGWNGTAADHNYNWHDAIHVGGSNCGADSPVPCDDNSHGTHTMGTMVGDDGGTNQIGVAPGAKWMGCRNMNEGNGTPATYTECFQWFVAPTNLANQNPDPTRAPHVINNSWGCPPSEGCNPDSLRLVVENTRAAGIVVVVSAGNAGPACSSVDDPPAIYGASFSVGSTTITAGDPISSFSSRGPVTVDGSNRLKPNISAPGSNVRSSVPGGGYANFSGTSMAGPHVAGAVALLLSRNPALEGQAGVIEGILQVTAEPKTSTQTCGGVPGTEIPNNTFGYGRVDAFAAADCAIPPVITAPLTAPAGTTGLVASVPAQAGHTYTWTLTGGIITAGQGTNQITFTAGTPGTTMQLTVLDSVAGGCMSVPGRRNVQVHFLDVPPAHIFFNQVHALARNQVTGGCGTGIYCPAVSIPREQMAVFLLVAKEGAGYAPPACTTPMFGDVPCSSPFARWINELARRGVTSGCGGGNYCPFSPVTREQMAVFLLVAKEGTGYNPPPCTTPTFGDVPCSSPFARWIEELARRAITGGCGGGNYCPAAPNTRGEMAVFIVTTFGLTLQ